MAFMIVRWEAGPCESQPKMLKGELENNPRILRDLVGNWHSDSQKKVKLTLSQFKKKKGDEIEDDDGDDVVRTRMSQDGVTATLWT